MGTLGLLDVLANDAHLATLHEGRVFSIAPSTSTVLALNNAQQHFILLDPATTFTPHLLEFSVVTDSTDLKVQLWEGVTVPTTGSGITPTARNRNRNSATAATVTIYVTSSNRLSSQIDPNDTATIIDEFWIKSTQYTMALPRGFDFEFVLKSTVNYAISLANAGSSCFYQPRLVWAEEG